MAFLRGVYGQKQSDTHRQIKWQLLQINLISGPG